MIDGRGLPGPPILRVTSRVFIKCLFGGIIRLHRAELACDCSGRGRSNGSRLWHGAAMRRSSVEFALVPALLAALVAPMRGSTHDCPPALSGKGSLPSKVSLPAPGWAGLRYSARRDCRARSPETMRIRAGGDPPPHPSGPSTTIISRPHPTGPPTTSPPSGTPPRGKNRHFTPITTIPMRIGRFAPSTRTVVSSGIGFQKPPGKQEFFSHRVSSSTQPVLGSLREVRHVLPRTGAETAAWLAVGLSLGVAGTAVLAISRRGGRLTG
jgi:hypothetical protein